MGKKAFYLLALVGMIILNIGSASANQDLIIKKVRVNNESQKARFVLDMNRSALFKVREEGNVITIQLPADVEWQSHKSKTFKKGVIKGYTLKNNQLKITVQPDVHLNTSFKLGPMKGSHRFVIDLILDERLSHMPEVQPIKKEKKVRTKKESTLFVAPSITWSAEKQNFIAAPPKPEMTTIEAEGAEPLEIKEIRLGVEGGRTRLVLETNHPIQFRADKTLEEVKLYALSGAKWPGAGALPYAQGAVHKLSLEQDGQTQYLDLKIIPGTIIDWENLDTSDPQHPRYTLDLTVLPPPPHDHSLRPEDRALRPAPAAESENTDEPQAEPQEAEEDSEPIDPKSGVSEPLVKKIEVKEDAQGTHLHLHLSMPQDFMVRRDGKRVWVEFPKMNWSHIKTSSQPVGLIENYFIDQSDPEKAFLVLNIKDGVVLTGENLIPAAGKVPAQYVLTMQTREKIGPHWGLGIMPPAASTEG